MKAPPLSITEELLLWSVVVTEHSLPQSHAISFTTEVSDGLLQSSSALLKGCDDAVLTPPQEKLPAATFPVRIYKLASIRPRHLVLIIVLRRELF